MGKFTASNFWWKEWENTEEVHERKMAGIQPFSAEAEYPEEEAKVKSNKIYFWERFEAEEGSKDVLWP